MINPHSSLSTDESLLPANSSGVGRGTAAKTQGPTFKKQQSDAQSCPSTAAELGRQLGQPRHSPPGTAMGRGLGGIWGTQLPRLCCSPFPISACWGSLSAPIGTLGCCMQGVTVPPPTQSWSPCQPRRCLLFYPTPLFSPSPLHLQLNSTFPAGATLQPWGPPCMSHPQGR